MALTLGNFLAIGLVILMSIIVGLIVYERSYGATSSIVATVIITLVIIIGLCVFFNWYNTKTATGLRDYKDYQSELSNGIDREITITAEDGRQIFYYEGKVDIESNHEDNYIKFESEEGKRYIIYYGVQDTIIIKEK